MWVVVRRELNQCWLKLLSANMNWQNLGYAIFFMKRNPKSA